MNKMENKMENNMDLSMTILRDLTNKWAKLTEKLGQDRSYSASYEESNKDWYDRLPETINLFRGTSLDEFNNIVEHTTPPGLWWSLRLRQALWFAAQASKTGKRCIIVMRDVPKTVIETARPILNEVIIKQDYDYSRIKFDYVSLDDDICASIKKMLNVEELGIPFYSISVTKKGISVCADRATTK